MKLSLTHKILLVVAIPLAIQIILFVVLSDNLKKLADAQQLSQHYVRIAMARERLMINERQRMILMAMFLATLDEICNSKYREVAADSLGLYKDISKLWEDKKERFPNVQKLWNLNTQRDQIVFSAFGHAAQKHTMDELLAGGLAGGSRYVLQQAMKLERVPFVEPYFVEDKHQQQLQDAVVSERMQFIYYILFGGAACMLLASLLSGLLFSLSVSRRLKIVLANIGALGNNQLKFAPLKGGDEISKLNAAVVSTGNKIREVEEFQAQTIAIIAEELNKPLTEVEAALHALPHVGFETLSEKGAKRLADSLSEVKRLESLVFELVNLDAAGRKPDVGEVDLNEMVSRCLKIVEPLTRLKSISINVKSKGGEIVYADADKTTQVLINFLSNAIKYSAEKSVIEISLHQSDRETRVSVRDQGPGIPEEFRSRIFKRFEQAEGATAQKPASSGLGLQISKEIIESENGQVGFETKVGEGSTFWFSLPRTAPQADVALSTASVSPPTARGWKPTLWKKALLVVALPMLVQLITILALFNYMHQNSEKIAELEKIPKMADFYDKLMAGVTMGGMFAMMYNADHNSSQLASTRAEDKKLRESIAGLEKFTVGDPAVDSLTKNFLDMIRAHLAFHEHLIKAKQNADLMTFVGERGTDRKENLLIDIRRPMHDLFLYQKDLIASNALASEEIRRNFSMSLFGSAIAASLVAGALALMIARSLTNRATRLTEVALRFSEDRELPEPIPGDDELAFVEQQLYAAGKKLKELENLRAEMIGITSHELRTPLTSIIALIEVMEAGVFGEVTEKGDELLARARLETSELIVLITNLLDLEKMESGKMLVTKQKMKVENVFEQIKLDNLTPADKKGVSLEVHECHQEIWGDSNRLSQALTAIIRSILERLPSKSAVYVACKTERNKVILTVGAPHGISKRGYIGKDRELARENMAISLARQTALQHGGNLNMTTSNRGRTIEIYLPVGA